MSVHLHRAVTRTSHRNFDPNATRSPSGFARVPCVMKPEVHDTGERTGPSQLLLNHALRDRLTVTDEYQIADVRHLGTPILSPDLVEDLPHRRSQWTDLRHPGLLASTGRHDHAVLSVDHGPREPQEIAKTEAGFQRYDQQPAQPQRTLRQQPLTLRVTQHPGPMATGRNHI